MIWVGKEIKGSCTAWVGKQIKGSCTADGISFSQNAYTNKADKAL